MGSRELYKRINLKIPKILAGNKPAFRQFRHFSVLRLTARNQETA